MGDMADYYREMEEDAAAYGVWPDSEMLAEEPPRITRASKWQSKGGPIAVRDMTTEHIQAVLRMRDQGRLRLPIEWFLTFTRELRQRKDRA